MCPFGHNSAPLEAPKGTQVHFPVRRPPPFDLLCARESPDTPREDRRAGKWKHRFAVPGRKRDDAGFLTEPGERGNGWRALARKPCGVAFSKRSGKRSSRRWEVGRAGFRAARRTFVRSDGFPNAGAWRVARKWNDSTVSRRRASLARRTVAGRASGRRVLPQAGAGGVALVWRRINRQRVSLPERSGRRFSRRWEVGRSGFWAARRTFVRSDGFPNDRAWRVIRGRIHSTTGGAVFAFCRKPELVASLQSGDE